VDAISPMCDSTIHGYVFDSAASSTINIVNPCFTVVLVGYTAMPTAGVAVTSTTNFLGRARFFNSPLWGGCYWDYIINGGDVGFELVHMQTHSDFGSQVNGGVLHMVNVSAYITVNYFPIYNVSFSTNAGIAGKISEIIGCFTYSGFSYTNANTNNPVNVWNDYALSAYQVLSHLKGPLSGGGDNSLNQTPRLSMQTGVGDTDMLFEWPATGVACDLYYASDLTPPIVWTLVTNAPVFTNGQWEIGMSFGTNQHGYYCLKPQQ
jgi:hypothetical protein